jgi:hypothetical protein
MKKKPMIKIETSIKGTKMLINELYQHPGMRLNKNEDRTYHEK